MTPSRREAGYFAAAAAKDGLTPPFLFPFERENAVSTGAPTAFRFPLVAASGALPRNSLASSATGGASLISSGTTFPYIEMPATEPGIKGTAQKPGFQQIFRRFFNGTTHNAARDETRGPRMRAIEAKRIEIGKQRLFLFS